MIDLHTHTTASDGRCAPAELVARAAAAGVTVLSVTDHDTVAGYQAAAAAAATAGVELVPGIEITAVVDGADVHVLGYFIDVHSPRLLAFLAEQRRRRIDRVRQIIDRLASHGVVLDSDAILQPGLDDPGIAIGRPWIARALVAGGHVADSNQAFDRWLGRGRPAFVPRLGATPEEVVARIHEAGGIASLAHPGLVGHDEWLPASPPTASTRSRPITPTTIARQPAITSRWPPGLVWSSQVGPTITPTRRTARTVRAASRCRRTHTRNWFA